VRFIPTDLPGTWLVEQESQVDDRGSFARIWCEREFRKRGLEVVVAQRSVSFNRRLGTLRGMHYQAPPGAETKLVRCTRGGVFDVAVDLRPDSPTFRRWVGVELTSANGRSIYVPRGFAHGFVTIEDDTEVEYQMSEFFEPGLARGIRWDDPLIGIRWPCQPAVMAPRDRACPDRGVEALEELRGL
jgi:dTDP-4-dehydrorhamnose 3,5-epimerase